PDSLEKDHCPPSFFVERVDITGARTLFHPQGTISIPYNQNSFVVNLAAVNYEDAHRQQFAYRFIKEGTEAWQQTGSQRNIIFNNLPPGSHRLQLKVFIKNNSWPEQIRELMIRISPPFWQTWWFILSAILLLVSAAWIMVRARIRNIEQKAAINTQLAELEMKGLHAQMNPHFIFNCLNSIKEMILQNEKKHASRYLSKFAQLIRINLEQSRQTFISVRQCINQLQLYLDMERIRLDRFEYNISISAELEVDLIQMSPMLMQPLVENAIWHGLHPLQGEKELWIRFYPAGANLICEVEDNGIGIVRSRQQKPDQRPEHQSFGLTNVRERLKVLNEKYKMKCSLVIIDKESTGENGKGTLVKLELTILNHSV
ncbi:MAG: histidine kinase, partial [Chitinophagaceae bacterium]|nr:histidine kinase [Chitinophagaceae bacterium]